MSDSDVDLLPNNVFTFQNESTTVSARGPNINASNLTGLSFRNNIMTSTMNMPRNFERQKYLEQSTYYSRPPNSPPMSLRSESSFRPRNYQHMYYPRGMSSQRSMINGRSGSPMSMRSMDSNATVSAADIAMAFKNMNFNKYDLRVIKDAYNQFMKKRMRRKIEKRRNLRLFLKGQRRRSGYDSGDLGSDSSISSDDCRSTRTSVYKDNMSSCRSTKTNYSDIRRTMREDKLYKDCTDNFRQNTFKNMLGVAPRRATGQSQNRELSEQPLTQKERFKSGFLLPSQRFNQSTASVPIPETQSKVRSKPNNLETHHNAPRADSELDSDQEEIFSEVTIREQNADAHRKQNVDPRKRCIEDEGMSQNKRTKLSSPPKNIMQPEAKNKNNEFEFLKPQFPVRKSGNVKVKETLLAKSAVPLLDEVMPIENVLKPQAPQLYCGQNDENKAIETNELPDLTQQSNSDMSMRPSFIKRKLYTQKFDMLESKNLSSDNLGANSPQTVYSAIQKEKNKARKLVTNQSCLSRDVGEDNNLLDLIHKIVPPDRMNVTNINKSEANNTAKNKSEDDKWDVTSVINNCNNDDVSDTYTDEEIFNNESSKMLSTNTKVNNENEDYQANVNKQANEKKQETEKKQATVKKQETEKKQANAKKQTNVKKITPEKKETKANKKVDEKEVINDKKQTAEKKETIEKRPVSDKKQKCQVLIEKLPVKKNIKSNQLEITNVSEKAKDANKENIYNCVKSFWDTDFESDIEGPPRPAAKIVSINKVIEKENVNLGSIQKASTNQVNKTLDASQTKFVWNNTSKLTVSFKSHSFASQVKAVNVNKSFTKRTEEVTKNKEVPQTKPKTAKVPSKTVEQPKKISKKILLDTYNSTASDNTQNETVISTVSRPRGRPNKINTQNDSLESNSQEKTKSTTVKSVNEKTKNNQTEKKVPRRTPQSPKEFSCCKEPVNVSKTAKKTVASKAKTNKTLDNYNSCSDNTLDEIMKTGNRTRVLRATRLKNLENSMLDDLKSDDSQTLNMTLRSRRLDTTLNMTLRSRRLDTSFSKGNIETTKAPMNAEVKARNTAKNAQSKDTLKKAKTIVTHVKNQKAITKSSGVRHSPRINSKAISNVTPVHKRTVKCK